MRENFAYINRTLHFSLNAFAGHESRVQLFFTVKRIGVTMSERALSEVTSLNPMGVLIKAVAWRLYFYRGKGHYGKQV